MLGEPLPQFLVYNNIVSSSRTFVSNITPIDTAWLKDFPGIEASVNKMNIEQVKISPVPLTVLQIIMGKYNANAEAMSKSLSCVIEADMDKVSLEYPL